jgi:hypothetical protein
MHTMLLHASKYNFFMLFTLALPVLLYTEDLLDLWLVEVPPYATIFLQLTIAASLIDSMSRPLITSAQATGHIRMYQSVVGGVLLLNVPISFLFLHFGYPPESVLIASVALSFVALAARLLIISPLIHLSKKFFISKVIARAAIVTVIAGSGASALAPQSFGSVFILLQGIVISVFVALAMVWLLGLGMTERKRFLNLAANIGARFG